MRRFVVLAALVGGCGKGEPCTDDPCALGETCIIQSFIDPEETTRECVPTPVECPELVQCMAISATSSECQSALVAQCLPGFTLDGGIGCESSGGIDVNLVRCLQPQ
jgi:hypothetical protein